MRRTRRCATTLRPLAAQHWPRHPTRSRWMKCWRTSEALKQSTDRLKAEQSNPLNADELSVLLRSAYRSHWIGLARQRPRLSEMVSRDRIVTAITSALGSAL